jgi:hypothetical protein
MAYEMQNGEELRLYEHLFQKLRAMRGKHFFYNSHYQTRKTHLPHWRHSDHVSGHRATKKLRIQQSQTTLVYSALQLRDSLAR